MPRATNLEIEALQKLVDILEESQAALTGAGEDTANLTGLIDDLTLAIDGLVSIIPTMNQIVEAMDKITSGEGGMIKLGDNIGIQSLTPAARGYGISREQTAPLETEIINEVGEQISSLDIAKLKILAVELDKINDADWSVKAIKTFAKEMRELADIRLFSEGQQELVDDLRDALIQLEKSAGEIEVKVIGLSQTEEEIKELVASITILSETDLSKLSEEFKAITWSGVEFPVENIKAFAENLEELSQKGEAQPRIVDKLAESIENLRRTRGIAGPVKELGDALASLSDEELIDISDEFRALKGGADFSVENIRDFAEALSSFDVKEGTGENIKQLEVAFKTVTDTSQLTTKEIKELGQNLSELEGVDLERLVIAVNNIADIGFDAESVKAYADAIKDIQSRGVISESGIREIDALDQALKSIGREQALPFEDITDVINASGISATEFTEDLKYFSNELNRASRTDIKEFNLELQFLKDNLSGLGLSADVVDRIVEHFDKLGTIESPARFFEELSQLGLPDKEVEKFAESFLTLRRNSGLIDEFREKLESIGIAPKSIDDLIKRVTDLDTPLTKLKVRSNTAKTGIETLTVSMETGAGVSTSFAVEVDKLDRSLAKVEGTAKKTKSELRQFVEALKAGGVGLEARREIATKAFGSEEDDGLGATKFSKLNWKELEDGAKSFTTVLSIGKRGSQQFKIELNELGEVMKTLGGIAQKSQLRQFAEGLKAAGATRETRRTIVEQTTDTGVEGLSSIRITELDGDITRLTGNLKLSGDILKAYTVYWDEFGKVMDELPMKDTTVSIKDFTEQLSDRVGAIDSVTKMVDKYGFELSDLKKMSTEASTGLTRLDFAMESQGGATEKLTLHVTEFGKVLTDTQRRFRTFAGGIIRNVGESFKWAVAITAVYGPLRKLQDLVQISIDNEAKLADIGVVLGKNTSELQGIFADAAQAAQATGESLNGVIEGYALAYRATGSIGNEAERAAVSQQLLIDSLVLSKLSAIDQAEAMDTLVAGLLQTGRGLDEGAVLLNKWVAVSKAANVTVDTLASSFAIMATAGEGVGLSFDEMNAIIAIVAAKTELSATQAGNAVRAFVSGFQTQNAREELSKFGIAVEDLNGDARNFMAVMYDIKTLMDAGLIDEAELNRLGTALGGRGARRGAQFTTFLKSLNEVQGLVTVSAEAQGDAYEALGVKMDTVQTAITNLATSFQVLANAVGTDGGVLDLLKGLLSVLDDITKSATSFVAVMGKAAPFLAVAGSLYTYGKYGSKRLGAAPTQFGGFIEKQLDRTDYGQQPAGGIVGGFGGANVGAQASATGTTMAKAWGKRATAAAPYIGVAMVEGMMLAINIRDKDWDGLGGQIAGGILGAPFGPIGIIIGSTIGESLINALNQRSGEFEGLFRSIFAEAIPDPDEGPKEDESREDFVLRKQKEIQDAFIAEWGGTWKANLEIWDKGLQDFARSLIGIEPVYAPDLETDQLAVARGKEAVSLYDEGGLEAVKAAGGFGDVTEETIQSYKDLIVQLEEVKRLTESQEEGKFLEGGELDTELERNALKYADVLENDLIRLQDEFRTSLVENEITAKKYNESMERMGSEGEAIIQIFTVMNDTMGDNADVLSLIADVVARTSQEEIDYITILVGAVDDLREEIKRLDEEGDLDLKIIAEEDLAEVEFRLDQFFNQVRAKQREPLIQFDAPVNLDTRSIEDHNRVVAESMRILEEQMQENIRLGLIPSNTTIEEVLATHEAIAVAINGIYLETMQIPMDIYTEAMGNLAVPGRIAPPVDVERGVQVKEIDQTQASFMAAYNKQYEFLKEAFGDLYQGDFSTVGIVFSDGVDVLHLDNLAMQLAMNDLIDVNQKQLEGVYNLPTDSSFYVPFQGYKLGFGDEGGAGGLSGAATELKEAADHLKSLEEGEDWGESLEQVMADWFGAVKPGPTDFELKYPKVEKLPEEPLGPPDTRDIVDNIGPWLSDARERVTEPPIGPWKAEVNFFDKFGESVDSFNKGVDSQLTYFEALLSTIGIGKAPEGAENDPIQLLVNKIHELITGAASKLFLEPQGKIVPLGVGTGAGIGPDVSFSNLDSAATKLDNFASVMQTQTQYTALGPQASFGGTTDLSVEFAGMLDLLSQKISNLSGFTTNLKISSISTTNLIVDGRTLAQVIKPYLYSDMIRFEDSSSSVTKNIVV